MIVRKISLLIAAAGLFALLGPRVVAAQDIDGDGTPDVSDPCPHVFGGTPGLMASPYIKLDYGGTGPGSSDDSIKLKKLGAFFITHAPYDPDSVDTVHITFRRNTTTGADLWTTDLAAGSPWFQVSIGGQGHQQWNYNAPSPGVGNFNGLLRNAKVAPFNSGLNRLTIKKAKDTNINGVLAPDYPVVILEVENGFVGFCFAAAVTSCTYGGSADVCLP